MEEEQSGLEKCIQICARSENIEEYQLCLGRRRERRRQDVGFLSRISALQLSRGATGATVLGAVDDDLLSRDLLLSVTTKRKGRAPLLWAVERGYMTIVRPLLEQGLDAEVNDQNGHTALQLAARGGHISIFKLLLEKGASVQ